MAFAVSGFPQVQWNHTLIINEHYLESYKHYLFVSKIMFHIVVDFYSPENKAGISLIFWQLKMHKSIYVIKYHYSKLFITFILYIIKGRFIIVSISNLIVEYYYIIN